MASRTTTAPPRIVRTVARQASLGDASADTPSSRPGSSARMAEAKPSEIQDIWRRYKTSGGQDLRDRLILTYAPLVKYVAGRLGTGLPAHVEEGDLISYGLLGLIGAIERYELDRDVKFETYAIARIKGSTIASSASRPTRSSPPRSASARAICRTASPRSPAARSRRSTSCGRSPRP